LIEARDRPDRGEADVFRRGFEEILERSQNASRLVGAECGAGKGFGRAPSELRVVLAFPDAYEVGISNQAIQILYHLASTMPGVAVERAYLPWVDVIAELRAAGVPLLTLETWTPVRRAHLLGISLQHELNFTNVLELLDLSRITMRAAGRGEDEPLVIAGGPAVANFLPLAPFLDAVLVGEGEEAFPEMLEAVKAGLAAGEGREARKVRLSRVPGVFVPGVSTNVRRRALARLAGAPYPSESLVPLTAGIHDRAWLEVMRGCSRGCRFCQAGMWYRPVRERPVDELLAMAGAQLAATGHEELALSSLSTTDYSALGRLMADLTRCFPEVRLALPSLRVDSAAVRLGQMAGPSGTSITLAPEAGSQRLRDVINKNVDEADIIGAVREAFGAGRTTLKLYFMIGLPTETDEDVEEIVRLCRTLRAVAREVLGARAHRLQLNVSVTNFIPKPFTPFQWAAMADRETLRRRQEILRAGLSRIKARLALHGVDNSYLEAALARGGPEMADVIEAAWRGGARFDSWTEQERPLAWANGFAAVGPSAAASATSGLARDGLLPWDVIEGVVSKGFLWEEYRRALGAEVTPDCRSGECGECGACSAGVAIDLAVEPGVRAAAVGESESSAERIEPRALRPSRTPANPLPLRYLLTFSVTGRARFVAHLDSLQLLRRAIRRAGGRLALSVGMRPKPLLALALPRGVGVESRAELCEFVLSETPPPDFRERLQAGLPEGFQVLELQPYHHRRPAAARVSAARYRLTLSAAPGSPQEEGGEPPEGLEGILRVAADRYTCVKEMLVERRREGRTRMIDVRAHVAAVEVLGPACVEYTTLVTPRGSVRAEEVMEALARLVGERFRLARTERMETVLS
jgi:radical SAM-linked protein